MKLFELHDTFDLEKFKKDCSPFLKLLKGCSTLPFHGASDSPDDYEIRTFKERAGPRDTPKDIHWELNQIFKEKLGHEIRNWMFITGSPREARVYGPMHAIFPIGENFHYVWSPYVEDMSTHRTNFIDRAHNEIGLRATYDDRVRHGDDNFLTDVATTSFKVDTDLKDGLESSHEIHLKCERFYIFKCLGPTFENTVNPYLRKAILSRHETD